MNCVILQLEENMHLIGSLKKKHNILIMYSIHGQINKKKYAGIVSEHNTVPVYQTTYQLFFWQQFFCLIGRNIVFRNATILNS